MPRFASVLLVDREGRLLLQERDEHAVIDPERWGLPGGHVEDGESPEAAAYRELSEETGVLLAPGTLEPYDDLEVWHEAYRSLDTVHLFAAGCDLADPDIECREGRQMVFVAPAAALALPLTASATHALPDFLSSDLYRKLAP